MVKPQLEKSIKTIRSDSCLESMLKTFYEEHGILHQRSYVSKPQQNAKFERRHHHILNIIRALMFQSNIPKLYCSYSAQHEFF